MKTYIISKKKHKKIEKNENKNFKWVFELEDEVFCTENNDNNISN
jgi:hypothetical protein